MNKRHFYTDDTRGGKNIENNTRGGWTSIPIREDEVTDQTGFRIQQARGLPAGLFNRLLECFDHTIGRPLANWKTFSKFKSIRIMKKK